MPRPRDPFNHALASLRGRALEGVYAPGRPVVIIEEARRLALSTTPVREALACLCGEGLMERAPRAGFAAPRLDAALVRDRFWVRCRCLTTSLDLTVDLPGATLGPGVEPAERGTVGALFDRIVGATGNRAMIETFARVDAQLRMLGDAEARVFADLDEEARELGRIATGSRPRLRAAIEAYHQRRMESAAVLILEVERPRSRPPDPE